MDYPWDLTEGTVSEAQESDRFLGEAGEPAHDHRNVPEGLADLFLEFDQTDDQVPERRHVLGGEAGPDGRAVLPEGDIPDPVVGFEAPVVPDEGEKTGGGGELERQAGDAVDNLVGGFAGILAGHGAGDPEDLTHMGKGQIAVEGVRSEEGSDFKSAVGLIDRSGRPRGEKPRSRGFEGRP